MTLKLAPLALWLTASISAAAGATDPTAHSAIPASESRLVILGTGGGPIPQADRSQPANLLIVRGKAYLIDCGDGTSRQITKAGYRVNQIGNIFLTHLHFDHTGGLSAFMGFDWMAKRTQPVAIYGPPGSEKLVQTSAANLGVAEAIFAPQVPDLLPLASVFAAQDFDLTTPREIYRDENVRVTAVENSHYSTMQLPPREYGRDRSYSLRFDTPDRSIVFTGDTGPSAAVEALARDADILVSEAIDLDAVTASIRRRGAKDGNDLEPLIDHMRHEHLTPEEVGKLATRASVKMVVLTHLAGAAGPDTSSFAVGVRREYSGPVVVAQDLDAF